MESVVGYTQQAALEIFQSFFEPVDGINVKVVGGLIENQKVRGSYQCTCQGDSSLLATAHDLDSIAGAMT
jgi:hypothetical protein